MLNKKTQKRMLKTFPKGGIHPPENKITSSKAIKRMAVPSVVNVPIEQHIGIPAEIIVETKQKVSIKLTNSENKSSNLEVNNVQNDEYVIKDNIENNLGEKKLKEYLQKFYEFDGVKKDKISSKIKQDIKNYKTLRIQSLRFVLKET